MATVRRRRFGSFRVRSGPFSGSLHVSSKVYQEFFGELLHLHTYLNHRLLPTEPEEVEMQGILTQLQNLLEHESEELIRHYTRNGGAPAEGQFCKRIDEGYVSFKAKCDWLVAQSLITQSDWEVMDEVRRLRNDYVHTRPSAQRRRFSYRGFPLLTRRSIRQLFVDVELILRKLRSSTGRASKWMTIPPAYASELGWPKELIEALVNNTHTEGE